jgi:hypothetical protein
MPKYSNALDHALCGLATLNLNRAPPHATAGWPRSGTA